MHAERVKLLWNKNPTYKRRIHPDLLIVRQYSMLISVLLVSVIYRLLSVVVVQAIFMAYYCKESGSNSYAITVCAENALFVSIFLWSAGASASESWMAGLANRVVLPLFQAGFLGCFCANVMHFFASAVALPACWPAYFTGILWGITWLNLASFVVVACLLAQLSSPLNLFTAHRQTDKDYGAPTPQEINRA